MHSYLDKCIDCLGLGGWDCTYDFSSITLLHGQPTPCSEIYLHLWRVGAVVQELVMAEASLHIPMHSAYQHFDVALVFPLVTVCCDTASQGRGQILYC